MSTRKTVINLMARRLGAWTGSISSGTGTTAVLGQRIDTVGDNNIVDGDILWMLDAANETDKDRVITTWADSTGTATFATRSDSDYSNETYIVLPGNGEWTRADFYTAINDRLQKVRRSVESALPTIQNETRYRLTNLSWIRHRGDVFRVFYRPSPNLVDNAQFDNWKDGPAAAPTRWTLAGASGTVARTTSNILRGAYGASITRTGADTTLTHTIGLLNGQLQGVAVTFEADVYATVASRARIGISDGVTTTYSSYHTGGSGIERLTVTKTLSSSASNLQVICSVDTGNTSATFSNLAAEEASTVSDTLTDTGDSAYRLQEVRYELRELGGTTVIELESALGRRGQLVVYSSQPFPTLSSDTAETDCPDGVIVPAALYELSRRLAKGKLYDRYAALMAMCEPEWTRAAAGLIQIPVPQSPSRVLVRGA